MNIKHVVKASIERFARVYVFRALPRGTEVVYDIRHSLPRYRVETVFDVGANVGQSAKRYLHNFPGAQIYCFEPVQSTFRQLQSNLAGHHGIHCVRLALASSRGRGQMLIRQQSTTSSLVRTESVTEPCAPTEDVDVATLDEFCGSASIEHINYLKIDTEGGDLEVLEGGTRMLSEQRVDFVEVEASMHPGNRRHVPFELLKAWLESKDYLLFGIYAQVPETPSTGPYLRRTNATFISHRVITAQRHYGSPTVSR